MLEVKDVCVDYGAVRALRNVSLVVQQGSIVALLGANGAGKSTLLSAISGLVPYAGHISWLGERLPKQPAEVVKRGIVQVPEGRQIFSNLSVYENLLAGAHLRRDRRKIAASLDRVYALFPRLKERSRQYAGTLSGGERQMLAIARGLMSEPSVLMVDEPSLGLSPLLTTTVLRLIREINDQGVTVLLVEQNARKALEIADRGYVLRNGEVVMEGPGSQLIANPAIQEAYLGASRSRASEG